MRTFLALASLLACGLVHASDYGRDGGTADFMCCADKACTTIISQHADAVRARDACGKLVDVDRAPRWIRSNAFKISPTGSAPPPVNSPPTIVGTPLAAIVTGQSYVYLPTATDADSDPLTFSITGKPAWAAFDTATGKLYGVPPAPGIFSSIKITVSDGKASAATPVFSITVTQPPPATCTPPAPADLTQPGACPSGTTGNWIQRKVYSCVGTTWTPAAAWAPATAPSGVCTAPPPPTGTPTAAVICTSGTPFEQPFAACTSTTLGQPTNDQAVLYCPQVVTLGSAQASCASAYWYNWGGMQAGSKTLTNAGWYPRGQIVFGPPPPPPPPPPPATGTSTLGWTGPTKNDDGTTLTNLAGYRIVYGTSPAALTQTIEIANPGISTYIVDKLASGTWYFTVRSYNSAGVESLNSGVASKVVQ